MKLNELPKIAGRIKSRKRIGRGIGSGKGKRAGRGNKGQKSRSGGVKGPQFEGGQMPLQRRLPALRGFKREPDTVYSVVNLHQLEDLPTDIDSVDAGILNLHKLIRKPTDKVKLLGRGKLTRKLNIKVHAVSANARDAVTAAGGQVEVVG